MTKERVTKMLGQVPRVSAKDYYYLRNIYAAITKGTDDEN